MKKLFAVIKNELLRYFTSPLAYVYLITFLILNGSFAVYFGHFIDRGVADLSPMFAFQPWLYLLFITGISMRLWSEEFKSKTIVQIMTMPVSTITLVWGKFFASWIFCAIALLLTFPFVITVNILGEPDNGVIFLGYIGSLILAGSMLAISQTMSALTKNQVIALVLAVIANLLFFLSGLEYVLAAIRPFVPSYITDMIASFSFLTHFNTTVIGLLELRDIIFFASIIGLFNFTTVIIIDFKTSGTSTFLQSDNRKSYIALFAAFLIIFAGINLVANNLLRRIQYDFTEEKIYTLDRNTVNILKNIQNPVTIKLYYSPVLGKNDPSMRNMFDRIKVLLSQYKSIAGKNFEYKIYTPYPFDRVEDLALGEGIEPLPSVENNSNALFGMTITDDANSKQVIPFLAPERAGFMEYDISEKIFLLSHKKKTLGVITSLPMLGGQTENNMIFDRWEIVNQLEKFYNIKDITTPEDFKNIDLLMIAHPKNLNDDIQQAIKDYSLNGGKTMIFLDIAPEALRLISSVNSPFESSEFEDLSKFFGFKFYPQYVAADFDNSILVDTSSNYKTNTNFTNDVIQFIVKKDEINPKMPETANLKEIMFSSASVLMPANKNVNFTILIKTSKDSAILPSDVVKDNTNPADILRFYEPDDNTKILAARISSKNTNQPIDAIVVTDTDILYDSFWTKIYNLPNSRFIVPILDNANFVLNSLETLSGENYLSSLRGKSAEYRRFNKIERIRRENKLDYSKKELEILEEIDSVKQDLQNIWLRKDFENREMFTSDDLLTIKNIRTKLDKKRQELGDLKKDSNADLEKRYLLIKIINIYLIASLIAVLLLLRYFTSRNKQQKISQKSIIRDKKLIMIFVSSLIVIAAGSATVYLSNRSNIDLYENKPVFANLSDIINEIDEISLTSNKNSTTLSFVDQKWINKEHPEFPIMQEQVRSFLSALIEASYYEKKSDKAENLAIFGLLPKEEEISNATEISLKTQQGEEPVSFILGNFDIDLGRGSKAAYIRFPQSFQVWMINADFVDASSYWQDWTLHTMWDLKIGRLKSFDHVKDVDLLTDMTKILINTDLIESVKELENAKKLYDIVLKDENYNAIYLRIFDKDGEYYVKYDFLEPVVGFYAKELKEASKDVYYHFDKKNWDLIDYVKKHKNK